MQGLFKDMNTQNSNQKLANLYLRLVTNIYQLTYLPFMLITDLLEFLMPIIFIVYSWIPISIYKCDCHPDLQKKIQPKRSMKIEPSLNYGRKQ